MAGQTINDRLLAARHSLAGQGLAKSVCKATTEEMIGPKKKHLDCKWHLKCIFFMHQIKYTASCCDLITFYCNQFNVSVGFHHYAYYEIVFNINFGRVTLTHFHSQSHLPSIGLCVCAVLHVCVCVCRGCIYTRLPNAATRLLSYHTLDTIRFIYEIGEREIRNHPNHIPSAEL